MNTYELMAVHIDTSQGVAKPMLTVRVRDTQTPVSGTFNQDVNAPAALVKANAIVADVLAFIQTKYGVTATLPPIPPVES